MFFAAPPALPPPEEPPRARLGQKNPKSGSAGTVGSQKLVFLPLSPQNGPLQGWKGRGSFGFGCFPPPKKTPKLLKLPQNALLVGPAPKLGIETKTRVFSPPKKVLSQRFRVVPGEGEELLYRFSRIFPQSKGMEEQMCGVGGWVLSLSPPHSDSAKTALIRPKMDNLLQKKQKGFKTRNSPKIRKVSQQSKYRRGPGTRRPQNPPFSAQSCEGGA